MTSLYSVRCDGCCSSMILIDDNTFKCPHCGNEAYLFPTNRVRRFEARHIIDKYKEPFFPGMWPAIKEKLKEALIEELEKQGMIEYFEEENHVFDGKNIYAKLNVYK